MTDRAAELPFTEAEAERSKPGAQVPAEAGNNTGRTVRGSPSSQPLEAPGIEPLLAASTASGPVALPTLMKQEREAQRADRRSTTMTTCACGGRIRIDWLTPTVAIKQHATTTGHKRWRRDRGFSPDGMPT